MKIEFPIEDDKTVTNTTLKLTAQIRGSINGSSKEEIDARVVAVTRKLFGDEQKWAYSNFAWGGDKLTFSVTATTRIPTTLNDNLDEKVETASTDDTKMKIHNLDASIPTWDIRKAESEIRLNVIKLAHEEAERMGGQVTRIIFEEKNQNSLSATANFKATAFYDNVSEPTLGHSEKIFLKAVVHVKINKTANKE